MSRERSRNHNYLFLKVVHAVFHDCSRLGTYIAKEEFTTESVGRTLVVMQKTSTDYSAKNTILVCPLTRPLLLSVGGSCLNLRVGAGLFLPLDRSSPLFALLPTFECLRLHK